ncbi:MAG: metallophosphoesterase [Candidatus Brocadiia bacterium]
MSPLRTAGSRWALVMGLVLALGAAAGAEPVAGVVFEDANANGRRDAGERGIEGVPVTDGVSFAVTDAQGRYRLEAGLDPLLGSGKRPILTVSFPSGTWPTAGWMRRVGDESGTDFGLARQDQRLPFVFVHATDPHVPRGGKGRFAAFRRDIEALGDTARFCIMTGDLANNSDGCAPKTAVADFQLYVENARDFPIPIFAIPGNHDCAGVRAGDRWDPSDPRYAYGLYWEFVGPLRWSFNYAGHHFVGLDFNRRKEGRWVWGIPASAAAWLERDLEHAPEGAPVLLFVHWPMGAPRVAEVVRRFPVRAFFAGHSHGEGPLSGIYGDVPGWHSGSIAQTGGELKPGYRLVWVKADGLETFYNAAGQPHWISVDRSPLDSGLGAQATVSGAFYDVDGAIERLRVGVGSAGGACPFRRTPICCRFEAELDLSGVAEGFRRLRVEVADGDESWERAWRCLVLSGHQGDFAPAADARLALDLGGVDTAAEVVLNGKPLATLEPTRMTGDGPFRRPIRDAQTVSLDLPRERLERLNRIDLVAGKRPDDGHDAFCVLDVRIRYQGKVFRDPRRRHGRDHPRTVARRTRYLVDLMPD